MSESRQQKAIIDYLKLLGAYVLRINSGSVTRSYKGSSHHIQLAPQGTPDLLFILGGVPVFVEVKKDEAEIKRWQTQYEHHKRTARITDYNRRSVWQHKAQNQIRKAGGFTLVCCSVKMLEEDLKALKLI